MKFLRTHSDWLILGALVVPFCLPIFIELNKFNWTEGLYFNKLRLQIIEGFLAGHWPAWHPLVGPGGSSTIFIGINPWEYKSVLYAIFKDIQPMVFVQFLLLLIAFASMCSSLFKEKWVPLTAILFVFFYNLDLMPYYTHHMTHSSTWMSFLFLLGLINQLERDPWEKRPLKQKKLFCVFFFLAYWFSFQGSQIVIWVIQFNVMLLLSIVAMRLLYGGSILKNGRNVVYYSGYLFGAWSLLWNFYWILANIFESSRAGGGFSRDLSTTVQEFVDSFLLASHVSYVVLYYGIWAVASLIRGAVAQNFSQRDIVKIAFVVLAVVWTQRTDWSWNQDDWLIFDSRPEVPLPAWVSWFCLGVLGVVGSLLFVSKSRRKLLVFEFPFLALGLFYFLYESAYGESFGPRPVEDMPPSVLAFIFAVGMTSLFSKYEKLRRFCVYGLLVLVLLRSHLTIPMIRFFGILWHMRRDTVYWGICTIIPVGLGLSFFLDFAREKIEQLEIPKHVDLAIGIGVAALAQWISYRAFRDVAGYNPKLWYTLCIVVGVFLGIATILYLWQKKRALLFHLAMWFLLYEVATLMRTHTFRFNAWCIDCGPVTRKKVYTRIFDEYGILDNQKRAILMTRRGGVSGFHSDLGLWQINMYDSLVPAPTQKYLKKYFVDGETKYPKNCHLPFVWFAKNLLRIFDCDSKTRNLTYLQHIGFKPFDLQSPQTFDELGLDYVMSLSAVQSPYLEYVDVSNIVKAVEAEEVHKHGSHGKLYEGLYLYRSNRPRTFSFASFRPGDESCEGQGQGQQVEVESNYFKKPYVKRRVGVEFEAETAGCLRLAISYSKHWRLYINGTQQKTSLVDGMYLGIPIKAGTNSVELVYLPHLLRLLFFSMIGFVGGLVWPWKMTQRVFGPSQLDVK